MMKREIFLLLSAIAMSTCIPTPQFEISSSTKNFTNETHESISRLATLWLTSATEDWIKADPTYAHSLFLRMDDLSLTSELLNFTRSSLSLLAKALGPYHPETLNMEHDLGVSYMKQGQFEEALTKLTYLVAKEDRSLGHEHPYTLRTAYKIGLCLTLLGHYNESLTWCEVTLTSALKMRNGEEYSGSMQIRNTMVYALYGLGRVADAWELNEKVMEWTKKEMSPSEKLFLAPWNNRAFLLAAQEKWNEAKEEYQNLFVFCVTNWGEDDEFTLTSKMGLARSLWNLGVGMEAIRMGEEVVAARNRIRGLQPILLEITRDEVTSWKKDGLRLQKLDK